jgi:hypothetical protein
MAARKRVCLGSEQTESEGELASTSVTVDVASDDSSPDEDWVQTSDRDDSSFYMLDEESDNNYDTWPFSVPWVDTVRQEAPTSIYG